MDVFPFVVGELRAALAGASLKDAAAQFAQENPGPLTDERRRRLAQRLTDEIMRRAKDKQQSKNAPQGVSAKRRGYALSSG
jgi:hypothetical protein